MVDHKGIAGNKFANKLAGKGSEITFTEPEPGLGTTQAAVRTAVTEWTVRKHQVHRNRLEGQTCSRRMTSQPYRQLDEDHGEELKRIKELVHREFRDADHLGFSDTEIEVAFKSMNPSKSPYINRKVNYLRLFSFFSDTEIEVAFKSMNPNNSPFIIGKVNYLRLFLSCVKLSGMLHKGIAGNEFANKLAGLK